MNKTITYIIFFLLISVFSFSCIIWDGAYKQSKYNLRFVDKRGNPIKNIELKVFATRRGIASFSYPVTNYTKETPVFSDSNGVISFYHLRSSSIEFGGWSILHIIKSSPLKEYCRFYLNGRQVYKIRYSDLDTELHNSLSFDSTGYYPEKYYVYSKVKIDNDSMALKKFLYYEKKIVIKNLHKCQEKTTKTRKTNSHTDDGIIEYIFEKSPYNGNLETGVYEWRHCRRHYVREIRPEDSLIGGEYNKIARRVADSLFKVMQKDTLK